MASGKTLRKNQGIRGAPRKRFEKGTDNQCQRILTLRGGKKRLVWGVSEGSFFRHLSLSQTELRD